jgi:hypothetical protein
LRGEIAASDIDEAMTAGIQRPFRKDYFRKD